MRKILLAASAAAAVLATVGSAYAQAPAAAPSIRPGRAPWVGAPFSGYPGATAEPGTVQVYLRGALYAGAFVGGASGDTVQSATGQSKNAPYALYSYFRLFPSFEGTTAQGLKYGAFGEIRQSAGTNTAGSNNNSSNLTWRRFYGYLGGSWGQVRFGTLEGVNAIMQTGTFEGGTGLHNGDGPAYGGPAAFTWPFLATSGTGQKLVYLSPSFSGFDFGVAFEPGTVGPNSYNGSAAGGGVAGSGGARLSQISGGTFTGNQGQLLRTRNTWEVVGRYQGNLGPVGVVASAGLIGSDTVKNSGLTGLATNGGPQFKYKDPLAAQGGLTVSYGGLTVGGAVYGGAVNPTNSRNQGPVKSGEKNALAWLIGASYATGPYSVTGSIVSLNRAGVYANDLTGTPNTTAKTGLARELGYGITGSYAYGPGATLNVDFIYSQRHQANVNILGGSTAWSRTGNNVQATALIINNTFVW